MYPPNTKPSEGVDTRIERIPGRALFYLAVCLSVFGFGVTIGGLASHRCEFSYVAHEKDIADAVDAPEINMISSIEKETPFLPAMSRHAESATAESEQVEEPRLIVVNKDSLVDVAVSELTFDTSVRHSGQSADALERCPSSTSPDDIRLLIAVTSTCCTTRAMQNRNAIRRTWMLDGLLEHSDVVSIKFMLSTPSFGSSNGNDAVSSSSSSAEAAEVRSLLHRELSGAGSNDLVMFGYALESYENLSLKTIGINRYMTLSRCGFTHLLKTDDDVYVRVPGALSMLGYQHTRWIYPENIAARRKQDMHKRLYLGKVSSLGDWRSPHRDKTSKWYLTYKEWPDGVPRQYYNVGWAYMLSKDLSTFIVEKMDYYEDVYKTILQQERALAAADGAAMNGDVETEFTLNRTLLPPNYLGMLKIEDVMTGYLLGSEMDVHPVKANLTRAYYSKEQMELTNKWQYLDEFCPPDTVFKHLDHDNLILMPVLSVNDRTGAWKHHSIQCFVRERRRDQADVEDGATADPVPELVTYELYSKASGGLPHRMARTQTSS